MRVPGRDEKVRSTGHSVATEDAARLAADVFVRIDRAAGVEWYERPGNEVDVAAVTLCRLRRARAGEKGGPLHGDEAVRAALVQVQPEALVWFASRAVSYMDETGFPEAVEPWFAEIEKA